MKICSLGTTQGFYYRPRIDDNILKEIGTEGLIGSSACMAGRIAQFILKDNIEAAEEWSKFYYQLFNENFYLEIQPTMELSQIKINQGMIELHKKLGIPMLATSDAHYLKKEHAKTHDVLLAIQSKSALSDENRWRFPGDTFYVMSRKEIEQAFLENGHEILDQHAVAEAIDNSVVIADQCNVSFKWEDYQLPKIKFNQNEEKFVKWANNRKKDTTSVDSYLRYKCIEGLKDKPNIRDENGQIKQEYKDRMELELNVISEMGYPDYFLIIAEIIEYCRQNNIPVGPGRGCFLPDNIVQTINDIKNIQDININDIVFSHDEKTHKITNTLQYDIKEIITKIATENKKMQCTNDHKIYAIKQNDFDSGIRTPKWYAASKLNEGDYIAKI